jgi:5-methylcytosine-specific restriction endonuclease McrBC GTP-binding regulatory subunit McrB
MKRRRDLMYEVGIKHINSTASNFIAVAPDSTVLIGDGSIDKTFTAIDAIGFKYSLNQRLDDKQLKEQFLAMISMYLEAELEDLSFNGETRVHGRERLDTQQMEAGSMDLQREVMSLIKRGKRSFILSGAPGVGKTYAAHSIVRGILNDLNPGLNKKDLSELVGKQTLDLQFHPAYSYEDFIEGLRPKSEGGGVVFNVEPGRLLEAIGWLESDQGELRIDTEVSPTEIEKYQVFREQTPDPSDKLWDLERDGHKLLPFFVVIDEINRANLPRVFGELLGLIEDQKRGLNEYAVKLPASGKRFLIPPHVIFVGTMNSADRSIRHLDAALMRRFTMLDIPIDYSALEQAWEKMKEYGESTISPSKIADGLKKLNQEIAQEFGKRQEEVDERQVGPSYLWPNPFEPIFNKEFIETRFKHSITPLLIEFLGGDGLRLAAKFVDGFPETWL